MRIFSAFWGLVAVGLFSFARLHAGGSVPFEFRDGLIFVEVQLVGYGPAKFLVDSGAGATLLDRGVAKAMGLKEGRAHRIQGVNGTTGAQWVSGLSGTLGGAPLPGSALSLDLRGIAGPSVRVAGLLGVDFFARRAVQLDFAQRVLRVLSASERASVNGEALRLVRRNDCFSVQVGVDGDAPVWMRVDTGCDSAMEWVKKSSTAGRRLRAAVKLGGITLPDVSVSRHATPFFAGEKGLIGNKLLANFCVTFDLPGKQLILARR